MMNVSFMEYGIELMPSWKKYNRAYGISIIYTNLTDSWSTVK